MKQRHSSHVSDSDESSHSQKLSSSKEKVKKKDISSSSDSSDSEETRSKPALQTSSPGKRVTSNPLEKYLTDNPSLTLLDLDNAISKHDDVCLLELPKTVDPQELLGKLINFDQKTKIKLNKTKYVIEPSFEEMKPVNLLMKNLHIIHPIAHLKMRERTKLKNTGEDVEGEQFSPYIPDNLKVRHPLFGADYEERIALDDTIVEKLDVKVAKAYNKLKKVKSKEKSKNLESTAGPVSSKKMKSKQVDTHNATSPKNKKNKIEKQEDIFTLLESHISDSKIPKPSSKELQAENNNSEKKDKNKRKNSIINSTVISDLQLPKFECDVSGILMKDEGEIMPDSISDKIKKKKAKLNVSKFNGAVNTDSKQNSKNDLLEFEDKKELSLGHKKKNKSIKKENKTSYESELDFKPKYKSLKSEHESDAEPSLGHKKKKNKSFEDQMQKNYESEVDIKPKHKSFKSEDEYDAEPSLGHKKKKKKSFEDQMQRNYESAVDIKPIDKKNKPNSTGIEEYDAEPSWGHKSNKNKSFKEKNITGGESDVDIKPKHKKTKSNSSGIEIPEVEQSLGHKKKKRKALEDQTKTSYESEVDIKPKHKKTKHNSREIDELEVDNNTGSSLGHEKKNKSSEHRKINPNLGDVSDVDNKAELLLGRKLKLESPVKKKQKMVESKDRSQLSSTLVPTKNIKHEPKTEDYVSESSVKKKRKSRNEEDESVNSPPKKKRKSSGAGAEKNSLIMDILSKVKSELDSSTKHKKKKNS